MEYGALEDMLPKFGPLNELLCADVSKGMLAGLGYLHSRKILHRKWLTFYLVNLKEEEQRFYARKNILRAEKALLLLS